MGRSRTKRAALLLLPILAAAAFLRLYRLADAPPGLYRDEAVNGLDALRGPAIFYPANNGREGLYISVQSLSVAVFGREPWALRLPSAIFGVLTVAGLYFLAAELYGETVALYAAFFLATSFWHIVFSRIGFRAIAAPCFLTWALYLQFKGMRRDRPSLIAFAGFVYGLGFYTYLAYRATPLLLVWILWRSRRRWRFAAAAAITAAPLAIYFALHSEAFAQYPGRISVFHHPHPAWEIVLNLWRTARMFFWHGDPNWRHNIAYRAELYWPVALLFAAGVVFAVARRRFLPLIWLAAAAVPVVLADDVQPHALRALLMTPAVFLLAGLAASKLRLPAAAIVILTLWLTWEPYHTYFGVWANNPQVAEAFDTEAFHLARRLPPGAMVLAPAENPVLAAPVAFFAGPDRVRYVPGLPALAVSPPPGR